MASWNVTELMRHTTRSMRVIALYSLKGGVGKTTAAVNLAAEAAASGWRTLLWDLDPQASASFFLRARPRKGVKAKAVLDRKDELGRYIRPAEIPGIDVVPAEASVRHLDLAIDHLGKTTRLRRLLKPLKRRYDLVLFDCPPSWSRLAESVFIASDHLMVPVIPTTLAMRTLDLLTKSGGSKTPPLIPFFSQVDRRKKLHRETVAAADSRFLETIIPSASTVEKMGLYRLPVRGYDRKSEASIAFASLFAELVQRLD